MEETKSRFKRICVFCGSSSGKKPSYQEAAIELGNELVGLLNVDGYYNSLLTFIDKAVDEGFISPMARRIIVSAPNAKELVRQLEEYEPEFDEITSKLVWDEVDRLSYVPGSEVTT
ncbi:hypothetical protein F2Q68_00007119 [Brassica cretica]|uniref:cytokinin riboside 5'-monophosphate phosphoribohydrolase n=1 Tax=Brassica cretica TaxID=69181 RepID=A0A8S9KX60_BRACR|nr:hypothetical protein F2Q68_00007119 [Brassica cretica]